jgi:hypothetical protein
MFLASYVAADFGECRETVERVGDGGVDEWHRQWSALADWLVELGDDSAGRGHRVSARDAYLRATNYYRTAYAPLFGSPVDPRLKAAFDRAEDTFDAVGAERKILIGFAEAEGAGGHCEGTARHLFHQRCYDWLDEALGNG